MKEVKEKYFIRCRHQETGELYVTEAEGEFVFEYRGFRYMADDFGGSVHPSAKKTTESELGSLKANQTRGGDGMNQDHKATERLKPLLHKLSMETKTYKKNYITIKEQTIKALEVYRT